MENYYGENQNNDFGSNNKAPQGSGKGQKFAIGALAIFAIFILFMWSSNLKQSISGPFTYNGETTENTSESATCESGDCLFNENLKLKDTDQDGISDWDELNVYGTSPYLEDSDSDGYTDREEIQKNQDPSCPVGRECDSFSEVEDITSENIILEQLTSGETASETTIVGDITEEDLQRALNGEAGAVRELFLKSGQFDKTFLDQYTDEELFQAYQAILSEQ